MNERELLIRIAADISDMRAKLAQATAETAKATGQMAAGNRRVEESNRSLAASFGGMRASLMSLTVAVGGAVSIMGLLAGGNEKAKKTAEIAAFAFAGLTAVVHTLGAALRFLSANPVMLTITAIVGLATAAIYVIRNWERVKEWGLRIWQSFTETLGRIWSALVTMARGTGDVIAGVFTLDFDRVQRGLEEFTRGWRAFGAVVTDIGNAIGDAVRFVWDKITSLFEAGQKKTKKAVEDLTIDPGLLATLVWMGKQLEGALSEAARAAGWLGQNLDKIIREQNLQKFNEQIELIRHLEQEASETARGWVRYGTAVALANLQQEEWLKQVREGMIPGLKSLGVALPNVTDELAKLAAQLESAKIAEALERLADVVIGLPDEVARFGAITVEIPDAWTLMLEQLKLKFGVWADFIMQGLAGLGDAFGALFQAIVSGSQTIGEALKTFAQSLLQIILRVIEQIVAELLAIIAVLALLGVPITWPTVKTMWGAMHGITNRDAGGVVTGPALVAVGPITERFVPMTGPHAARTPGGGMEGELRGIRRLLERRGTALSDLRVDRRAGLQFGLALSASGVH